MKFRILNFCLVALLSIFLTNCSQNDPSENGGSGTLSARLSENADFQQYLIANAQRETNTISYLDGLSEEQLERIGRWENVYGEVDMWLENAEDSDREEMTKIIEIGVSDAGAHLERAMEAFPGEHIDATVIRQATAVLNANGGIQLDVNSCSSSCSSSANDTYNRIYMNFYGSTGDWQISNHHASIAEAAAYSGCMHGCLGLAG